MVHFVGAGSGAGRPDHHTWNEDCFPRQMW